MGLIIMYCNFYEGNNPVFFNQKFQECKKTKQRLYHSIISYCKRVNKPGYDSDQVSVRAPYRLITPYAVSLLSMVFSRARVLFLNSSSLSWWLVFIEVISPGNNEWGKYSYVPLGIYSRFSSISLTKYVFNVNINFPMIISFALSFNKIILIRIRSRL